jgi:hypothetical protein
MKEWGLKKLLSAEAGGGAEDKRRAKGGVASTRELMYAEPMIAFQLLLMVRM